MCESGLDLINNSQSCDKWKRVIVQRSMMLSLVASSGDRLRCSERHFHQSIPITICEALEFHFSFVELHLCQWNKCEQAREYRSNLSGMSFSENLLIRLFSKRWYVERSETFFSSPCRQSRIQKDCSPGKRLGFLLRLRNCRCSITWKVGNVDDAPLADEGLRYCWQNDAEPVR